MSVTLTVCRRLSQKCCQLRSTGNLRIFSASTSVPSRWKSTASEDGNATKISGFRMKRELPSELKSTWGQLVYSGPQNTTVVLVKSFSLSTSLVAILLQPTIWVKYLAEVDSVAALLYIITTMSLSAVMLGTPFLLHILTKRYVRELYYDSTKDRWTAVVYNILVRESAVQFTSSQVKPAVGAFATILANGQPLLIAPQLIGDVELKTKLLGYDNEVEM